MGKPDREGYVFIGNVVVDSGMVVIGDPLLVLPGRTDAYASAGNGTAFEDVLNAIEDKSATGFVQGVQGDTIAVAFHTAYGDGEYPVFAKFSDDQRIVEVVIDLQMLDWQKAFYGIKDDQAE